MNDTEKKAEKKYQSSTPILAIILGLLAGAFWGLQAGIITGVLAYIALSWLTTVGLIPVGGPILYVYLFNVVKDWMLNLASIHTNPLIDLVFWVGLVVSIIYTAITTFVVAIFFIAAVADR